MVSKSLVYSALFVSVAISPLAAESPPPPDPISATIHASGQPRMDVDFLSKRAYQEGAAIVPYFVQPTPTEGALIDSVKTAPSIPVTLYGPSILITAATILQPSLDRTTDYGNAEWNQLLPQNEGFPLVALNRIVGQGIDGSTDYDITLESGDYYRPTEGWVESAVVGWIFSYASFATDLSFAGWYFHPDLGDVWIVDGGIETIPHPVDPANCPDDEVSGYYLWHHARQAWFYLSAGYSEWIYNFTFGVWEEFRPTYKIPDERYLGLTEAAAIAQAEGDNGRTVRVVKREGEFLVVTTDHSPDRLNLSIENGVVVETSRG